MQLNHWPYILVLCLIVLARAASANPTGVTGRTLKSTIDGCSCHSSSPSSAVKVLIAGPDSVVRGTTATYTLTISGGPAVKSGCDISTRSGTLAAISTNLKLSNKELTHRSAVSMTGGMMTFQFKYTAPTSGTIDTIFATGNSVNGNGNENGDSWNWAPNKLLVIVSQATGVDNTGVADGFALDANFPNPFHSSTSIQFSLATQTFTTLKIYDAQGREVATVVSDVMDSGVHSVQWNPGNLPNGVYLYRLQAGLFSETRKMVISQ